MSSYTISMSDETTAITDNAKVAKTTWKLALKQMPSLLDRHPVPKPDTHTWLRFNLLWFVVIELLLVPLPLWLYPSHCFAGWVAVTVSNCWLAAFLLLALARATYATWRLHRAHHFPHYRTFYPKGEKSELLKHLVVMCCYKEPLGLITTTLDTLKAQTEVSPLLSTYEDSLLEAKHLFVVVGLEEGTPDVGTKEAALESRYQDCFFGFLVTVHPKGIPGEMAGKCSNSNFATREGVRALWRRGYREPELITVTTLDADNLFHPRYFEFLGYDFFRRNNRHAVIWQAPLCYNLHLDKRPFFVRVTGVLRTFFMTGVLIPQNINTMSVFSMSLVLVQKGGFFHPGYQMDDIIYLLHAMIAIGTRVRIFMIPYPVVSGPTSGDGLIDEAREWGRQARRWTVGAAEVFHYFCIKFRKFDLRSGITYGLYFTHYYGLILCGMSLVNLNGLIASASVHGSGLCDPAIYLPDPRLVYLPLLGLVVPYIVFAAVFVLDRIGLRYMGIKEDIGVVRNVGHWLSTPLVLLAYSCVEFYAIAKLAIFGKDVCIHDPSAKENLAGDSNGNQLSLQIE